MIPRRALPLTVLFVTVVMLAACADIVGFGTLTPPEGPDASTHDAGHDARGDVTVDAGHDATDAMLHDGEDAARDALLDSVPDGPGDGGHDALPDVGMDAPRDAAPDATRDSAPDALPDARVEAGHDASVDGAMNSIPCSMMAQELDCADAAACASLTACLADTPVCDSGMCCAAQVRVGALCTTGGGMNGTCRPDGKCSSGP